mmetsp:Transcript_7007/g.15614  ORF Transcript_7007/g.15614 Transcript_7007/m.15614 type:complete len:226 (+) Transcript_7007:619-1296(+)
MWRVAEAQAQSPHDFARSCTREPTMMSDANTFTAPIRSASETLAFRESREDASKRVASMTTGSSLAITRVRTSALSNAHLSFPYPTLPAVIQSTLTHDPFSWISIVCVCLKTAPENSCVGSGSNANKPPSPTLAYSADVVSPTPDRPTPSSAFSHSSHRRLLCLYTFCVPCVANTNAQPSSTRIVVPLASPLTNPPPMFTAYAHAQSQSPSIPRLGVRYFIGYSA